MIGQERRFMGETYYSATVPLPLSAVVRHHKHMIISLARYWQTCVRTAVRNMPSADAAGHV